MSVFARSLDFERVSKALEQVDRAGMRRRAVYHFCSEMHDALAVVISQDGDVNISVMGKQHCHILGCLSVDANHVFMI